MEELIMNDDGTLEIPENLVPNIVVSNIDTIRESAGEVEKALEVAHKAQESVEAASQMHTTKWSIISNDNKEAIEALQKSSLELSSGLQAVCEAQKVMFENLRKISSATRYLFWLGTCNMATTKLVTAKIKSQLGTASKQKLSQRAKDALSDTLRQLKAQENLFDRLEGVENKYTSLYGEIHDTSKAITEQSETYCNTRISDVKEWWQKGRGMMAKKFSTLTLWLWILGTISILTLLLSIWTFVTIIV